MLDATLRDNPRAGVELTPRCFKTVWLIAQLNQEKTAALYYLLLFR